MIAYTERYALDNTSGLSVVTQVFSAPVKQVHSVMIRPDDDIELSFKPFDMGTGIALAPDESFSITWKDFNLCRLGEESKLDLYTGCDSGQTANVTIAFITG
jgi:hypothetical protein